MKLSEEQLRRAALLAQQRQQYQNLHNKSRLQRFIISSCTRCFIPLLTGMHS